MVVSISSSLGPLSWAHPSCLHYHLCVDELCVVFFPTPSWTFLTRVHLRSPLSYLHDLNLAGLRRSKITADGDCSHEIKRHLLLGRKVMTNLDSILKSRHITLPKKVCLVKAMVFPVVMCGCESWTVKKAEHQRLYVFELWCWRRLLRVP